MGYRGGPCTTGSVEHVRFFVDFGSGWVDAGVAATRVYDVATNRDCAGDLDHPYVHVVGVVLTPLRKFCASPVLPASAPSFRGSTSRPPAIPATSPSGARSRRITSRSAPASRFFPVDILDVIGPLVQLDPATIGDLIDIDLLPIPIPEPDPIGPVALNPQPLPPGPGPDPVPFSVERLSRIYSPDKLKVLAGRALDPAIARLALEEVPPHRLAANEVSQALSGVLAPDMVAAPSIASRPARHRLDLTGGRARRG